MKKVLFFTVALSLIATAAMAHDVTGRFGLGFVSTDAPVGGRYWLNEKFGIDGGLGFSSIQVPTGVGDKTESQSTFAINAGVPIVLNAMADRVNFLIRPGIQFTSMETGSIIELSGALEFEVFVTDDFTVSAAHGIAIDMNSPDNGTSTTNFNLFGNNWTSFGFHYYLKNK